MSRSADDDLIYPLDDQPADGATLRVEPGLLWVRLPLPFRLDHINVWAIAGEGGWTIVDCGIADSRTRSAWDRLLGAEAGAEPGGDLAGRAVERVIATHFHPDHIGLAGWLVERTGAAFAASLTDWLFARALALDDTPGYAATVDSFYRRTGLDPVPLAGILGRGNAYARGVHTPPPTLTRLRHGDSVTIGDAPWRVIVGGGHTPEQVCLFRPAGDGRDAVLISGDQVLPRISPNISVWPSEPDADPLTDFLASFEPLLELPEDVLVLPSHGRPFRGLHRRIAALRQHHAERLAAVQSYCTVEPRTAAQVADALFGSGLDPHQAMFAIGEAVAHLNHLLRKGTLARRIDSVGADRYGPPPADQP